MSVIIACTQALNYSISDNVVYRPKRIGPEELDITIDRAVHHIFQSDASVSIKYVPGSFEELTSAIDSIEGTPASIALFDLEGLYKKKEERIKVAQLKSSMDRLRLHDSRRQEFNQAKVEYRGAIKKAFVRFDDGELYKKLFHYVNEDIPIVTFVNCAEPLGLLLNDGVLMERSLPIGSHLYRHELEKLDQFYEAFGIANPNTREFVRDMSAYCKFLSPQEYQMQLDKQRSERANRKVFDRVTLCDEIGRDAECAAMQWFDP